MQEDTFVSQIGASMRAIGLSCAPEDEGNATRVFCSGIPPMVLMARLFPFVTSKQASQLLHRVKQANVGKGAGRADR